MTIETVAIISPGDMGHMVGKVIRGKGFRVITSLLGRSALSCARAERSGMEDVGSLRAVLQEADAVLSIMPPERARWEGADGLQQLHERIDPDLALLEARAC